MSETGRRPAMSPGHRAITTPVDVDVGPEPTTWLTRWRARGPATQAVVPGAYAWAVSVASIGWTSAAPIAAVFGTAIGIVVLIAAPVVERWAPGLARVGLGWGLVASALVTWALAPEAAVNGFDAARGISGMVGWALFAFAVASPAQSANVHANVATVNALPRVPRRRGDMVALFIGLALAVALQIPGWRVEPRDRALLLRLVAVAGGLGLVSTAGAIAGGPNDGERRPRRPRLRKREVFWLAAACGLLGAGMTYRLWRGQ